jgi:hypothetical protein
MTEPNPHHALPKVAIQFGGEKWLCYPFLSLRRLRDEKKLVANDILQTVAKSEDLFTRLDGLAALIWCGRIWFEKELAYPDVEEYIYGMGYTQKEVIKGYIIAIAEAMTGEKPDLEEEQPERPPVTDGVAP